MPENKKKPIIVNNKNDSRLKAYTDSLNLFNLTDQAAKLYKDIATTSRTDDEYMRRIGFSPNGYAQGNMPNTEYNRLGDEINTLMIKHPTWNPIAYTELPMTTYSDGKRRKHLTNVEYKKPVQPVIFQNKPILKSINPKLEPIKPLGIKPMETSVEAKLAGNVTVPVMSNTKGVTQNYTAAEALQIQGKPSGYINEGDRTGRQEFKNGGWLDGLDNNKYIAERDATSTVKTPAIATNNNAFKEKVHNPDEVYKYAIDAAGTVFYPASLAGAAIDFYQGDNVGGVAGLIPFGKGYKFLKNAKAIAAGAGASKSAKKFISGVNKIMTAHVGTQVYDTKSDLIDPLIKDKKQNGGWLEGLEEGKTEQAPDVTNATEYIKNWYNSPMYGNILKNQIADSGVKNPKRIERVAKRSIKSANKEVNSPFYDITPDIVDNPEYYGKSIDDYKGGRKINLNRNFVEGNPKLVNSLFAHELAHDNLMTNKDIEYVNKNTPEYNPAIHDEKTYGKLTDPGEVRSQIHSIRQLSGENKIYDPLTQPFKKEYLDKVNESYNQGTKDSENYNQLQRLRKFYSDDQITEMMNTISKSNSNDGKVYAKNGGWLNNLPNNKFDMGGVLDGLDGVDKGTQVPDATATAKPVVNLNFAITPAQKQQWAKNKRQAEIDMQVDHPEFYTNPNFLDKKAVKPYSVEDYKKGIKEPGLQTSIDPIDLVGTGVYKAGFKALGIKEMTKDAGKYLTTKTALKNTYKYNPWAKGNKLNPFDENAQYRMIGNEEGFKDALESSVIRPPQHHYQIAQGMPKEGTEGVVFKNGTPYNKMNFPQFDAAYYNKGYPLDKRWYPENAGTKVNPKTGKPISTRKASRNGYEGPYMAEVKGNEDYFMKEDFSSRNTVHFSKEDFPTYNKDVKFYKEDWLKGYKEVPKDKKQNTGWLDNLK